MIPERTKKLIRLAVDSGASTEEARTAAVQACRLLVKDGLVDDSREPEAPRVKPSPTYASSPSWVDTRIKRKRTCSAIVETRFGYAQCGRTCIGGLEMLCTIHRRRQHMRRLADALEGPWIGVACEVCRQFWPAKVPDRFVDYISRDDLVKILYDHRPERLCQLTFYMATGEKLFRDLVSLGGKMSSG